MKKVFISFVTALMSVTAMAQETDFLTVENVIINPGEEKELAIGLVNAQENFNGLTCNIALPDGLEFVQAYGTARRPSYIELSDRCEDMDILTCAIASYGELAGTLAVILSTDPGLSIYDNEGPIFYITVKASEGTHASSEIVVKNVVQTDNDYASHYLDDAAGTVTKPSTLADYIDTGVEGKPCILTEALTCAYVANDGLTLWAKDDNAFAERDQWPYAPTADQIAARKVYEEPTDFDQSNWVAITLPQALSAGDAEQWVGHKVSGISGVFTSKLNPAVTAEAMPTVGEESRFVPNLYCVANFDVQDEYWLMPPKPQEYATVRWAIYKDGAFYVPAKDGKVNAAGLKGAIAANTDRYEGEPLMNNNLYELTGIVRALKVRETAGGPRRAGIYDVVDSAPSAFYEFDLLTAETSEIMTGVNELNVNEADGPYFDLLGRLVKNPTPGIYIHNGRKVIVR